MSTFETYWPMDDGPGANTGMLRWRKMARLWAHDGVVRGVGAELRPQYYDPASETWVVGTGAVWVNGFYGEATANKEIRVPGNRGLIVARLRAGAVTLFFKPNDPNPWQDPDGEWEVPLHWLEGDGQWFDRRPFVQPGKGIADLPPRVPRRGFFATGPETEVLVGGGQSPTGGLIMQIFTDWALGWTPGRAYRVSAGIGGVSSGEAYPGTQTRVDLEAYLWDAGPVISRHRLFGPVRIEAAPVVMAGWTAFTLTNAQNCAIQLWYRAEGGGTQPSLRVPAHAAWMEVQDAGTA